MKFSNLFFAALLGMGLSGTAFAQTVPGTTSVPGAPGSSVTTPGAGVLGQPGTPVTPSGSVLSPGTAPVGTAPATIYAPDATAPLNGAGTLRSTTPAGTAPARSIRRANTGSGTKAPVRP